MFAGVNGPAEIAGISKGGGRRTEAVERLKMRRLGFPGLPILNVCLRGKIAAAKVIPDPMNSKRKFHTLLPMIC